MLSLGVGLSAGVESLGLELVIDLFRGSHESPHNIMKSVLLLTAIGPKVLEVGTLHELAVGVYAELAVVLLADADLLDGVGLLVHLVGLPVGIELVDPFLLLFVVLVLPLEVEVQLVGVVGLEHLDFLIPWWV